MKKSLRFCVLLALAAALLTVSAFADTGPKAQLKVLVKNASKTQKRRDFFIEMLLSQRPVFLIAVHKERRKKGRFGCTTSKKS